MGVHTYRQTARTFVCGLHVPLLCTTRLSRGQKQRAYVTALGFRRTGFPPLVTVGGWRRGLANVFYTPEIGSCSFCRRTSHSFFDGAPAAPRTIDAAAAAAAAAAAVDPPLVLASVAALLSLAIAVNRVDARHTTSLEAHLHLRRIRLGFLGQQQLQQQWPTKPRTHEASMARSQNCKNLHAHHCAQKESTCRRCASSAHQDVTGPSSCYRLVHATFYSARGSLCNTLRRSLVARI